MGTAQLLYKFDYVFGYVKSSTVCSTKKLKCAISEKTTHVKLLKEAIAFINDLQVFDGGENVTGRIKCFTGWLVTVNTVILI